MNGKTIGVWAVIIIIVAVGAYFIYNRSTAAQPASQPAAAATSTQTATSSDQVQGQDVSVGSGTQAAPGSVVSVLYVGKLPDGTVFDSSAAHDNQPLTFTLGAQGLIAGFQIGVNGMKEGGERLIAVPPAMGYGDQDVKDPKTGKVIIPANSTILFDVKLVKVSSASSTSAATPAKKTK